MLQGVVGATNVGDRTCSAWSDDDLASWGIVYTCLVASRSRCANILDRVAPLDSIGANRRLLCRLSRMKKKRPCGKGPRNPAGDKGNQILSRDRPTCLLLRSMLQAFASSCTYHNCDESGALAGQMMIWLRLLIQIGSARPASCAVHASTTCTTEFYMLRPTLVVSTVVFCIVWAHRGIGLSISLWQVQL